jgi:hypothetical protein
VRAEDGYAQERLGWRAMLANPAVQKSSTFVRMSANMVGVASRTIRARSAQQPSRERRRIGSSDTPSLPGLNSPRLVQPGA